MKTVIMIGLLSAAICAAPCWSGPMKLIPSSPLAKVLRVAVPKPTDAVDLQLDGAPGETISAQAVLLAGDKADTLKASLSALKSADGKREISPSAARLQWVRYMDIATNSANVPLDELVAKAPVSIPDPFWEGAERPVEAGGIQPLWIELEVPADALQGDYRGELTVAGRGAKISIPISLHVRSFRLDGARHQRESCSGGMFPGMALSS